jgi:Arc/MetJ family transcription regulator
VRVKLILDDELLAEAARLSGIESIRALVHEALRHFVESKRRKSLLDLVGKVELDPEYDYKKLRAGR